METKYSISGRQNVFIELISNTYNSYNIAFLYKPIEYNSFV